MPSVSSSSSPKVLLSSTVMTPSLPTLSIASAISSPMVGSAAEIEAVAAICSLVSTSLAVLSSCCGDGLDGLLDAPLERHRVRTRGHVAQALTDQRLSQHGGGRGAVTGDVVGLLRHFLDQLGPDLLPRVLELDLLGDRHTIVGDGGRAPLLLQDDVAAARAQRHLDGVGEGVHAALEPAARLLVERDHLRHEVLSSVGMTQSRRCRPGARDGRPATLRRSHRSDIWHSTVSSASSCLALRDAECNGGGADSEGCPANGEGGRLERAGPLLQAPWQWPRATY